jgi:hypothetical protein
MKHMCRQHVDQELGSLDVYEDLLTDIKNVNLT